MKNKIKLPTEFYVNKNGKMVFEFGLDEFNSIIEYMQELELEIECINKIIDKAIEYIENNDLYKEVVDYDYEENPIYVGCNDIKAREDLLNILKGESKNE